MYHIKTIETKVQHLEKHSHTSLGSTLRSKTEICTIIYFTYILASCMSLVSILQVLITADFPMLITSAYIHVQSFDFPSFCLVTGCNRVTYNNWQWYRYRRYWKTVIFGYYPLSNVNEYQLIQLWTLPSLSLTEAMPTFLNKPNKQLGCFGQPCPRSDQYGILC